jgi:uncharacterized protein (DUF2237 family)
MFYLPYTLGTKNVLRFNINKVLSSNQENDILSTPRPLFDGIMFLTACDDGTHDDVRHTLCQTVMTRGVLSFSRGKHSTYFHRICVFIHI